MNELKFKSHTEKEFWEKVYLAAVGTFGNNAAIEAADAAVAGRRFRITNIASKARAA